MKKFTLPLGLSFSLFIGSAGAATSLFDGGNINAAGSWDNGLPASGNDGTIAVTNAINTSTVFNFGPTAVVTHSAGTITSGTLSDNGGFNFTGGAWNMTGGEIITRYFLANNATFNLSGGTVTLKDVVATRHMGAANGGSFNISGSVVLDGTHASAVVQTGGTVDIASDWTGSWTWGLHSGDDWKNLFTGNLIEFDGAPIDGATFDSTFTVTNGGQTLSLTTIPEPSTLGLALFGLLTLIRRRKR